MYLNRKIEDLRGYKIRARNIFLFFSRSLILSIISFVIKACIKKDIKSFDADLSKSPAPSLNNPSDNIYSINNINNNEVEFGGAIDKKKSEIGSAERHPEAIRQLILIDKKSNDYVDTKNAEIMRSQITPASLEPSPASLDPAPAPASLDQSPALAPAQSLHNKSANTYSINKNELDFGGKIYKKKPERFDGDCGPEAIRQLILMDKKSNDYVDTKNAEIMRSQIIDTFVNAIKLHNILLSNKNGNAVDELAFKELFKEIFHHNKDYCASLFQNAIYKGRGILEEYYLKLLGCSNLSDFVDNLPLQKILTIYTNLCLLNSSQGYIFRMDSTIFSDKYIDQFINQFKGTKQWLNVEELIIFAETCGLHFLDHFDILKHTEKTNDNIIYDIMYVFTRGNFDASDTRRYIAIKKYFKEKYQDKKPLDVADAKKISITEAVKGLPDNTCFDDLKDFAEAINKEKAKFVYMCRQDYNHWVAYTQEDDIQYDDPLISLLLESFVTGEVIDSV